MLQAESAPATGPVKLSVTRSDAASRYSNFRTHAKPRAGASEAALALLRAGSRPVAPTARPLTMDAKGGANAAPATPALPSPGFYPADLSYFGGPVLQYVSTSDVYVNGVSNDFGNPGTFLIGWQRSQLIHVLDQYVGVTSNYRYQGGPWGTLEYPIFSTLGQNDLLNIVYAAASQIGSGYGHVYNIFLPKGVDYCDGNGACYSPDNPSTFSFCAFHGSTDFQDIGHVLFTLEPYQDVPGCSVPQPTPNGALIDSTASTLSHELSETITDPDPGTGWVAISSLTEYGNEVADICVDAYGNAPASSLDGTSYAVQLEYSNKYHGCSNVP
jgi:hypothetical protein